MATTPPPSPIRVRLTPSSDTARSRPVSSAAIRSRLSSAAASSVTALSSDRPLPRVKATASAAMSAMISMTAANSTSVKPARRSAFDIGDVGGGASPALAPVGAEGDDVVGRVVVNSCLILVGMPPGVERHATAFHIRTVPEVCTGRPLDQGIEALGRARVAAGIEEEEVECRTEVLDLQSGGLDPRAAEIGENAWSNEAKDQADNGQHHQHLDQGIAGARQGPAAAAIDSDCMISLSHSASSVMLSSAPMIDMIRAPITMLTRMMVAGPMAPIRRSRPTPRRCS